MSLPLLVGLATTAGVGLAMARSDAPWTLALDAGMSLLGQTVPAFRTWAAGRVPEWTDLLWGGFPSIAEPTTAALYPLHLVAYLATRHAPLRFFDVALALHFGILTAGTTTFLRRLGVGWGAALLGAALAGLSPFLHGTAVACVAQFEAMAWWPWTMAAAEALACPATPVLGRAMVLGWIALAAQVFAGIPEYAVYSGALAVLWLVLRRTSLHPVQRAGRIVLLASGAIAIAAPQIFTTLAYLPTTTRADEPVATQLGSLWLTAPSRMFLTGTGAMSGVTCFIGLGVTALVVSAVVLRRAATTILAGAAIGSFLLALGPQVGLYNLLHAIPPFGYFRVPIKLYGITELALAWTAALGTDALWRHGMLGARLAAVILGLLAVGEHVVYVATAERDVLDPIYAIAPRPDLTAVLASIAPFRQRLPNEPPPLVIDLGHPLGGTIAGSLGALVGMSSLHAGNVSLLSRSHATLLYGPAMRGALPTLLGVRYALARMQGCERVSAGLGWSRVQAAGDLCVLQNPVRVARFEAIGAATAVDSVDAMLQAVLEHPGAPPPVVTSPELVAHLGSGHVLVRSYATGHVMLTASSVSPTLLLIRESFVPGWRALVDGVPAPLLPAAGLYFAIPLGAGAHTIELAYRAPGLRGGMGVAAAWLLGTAVALAWRRRRAVTPD